MKSLTSFLKGAVIQIIPIGSLWPESRLLTFVNCVFEAQSGHLCQEVANNQHFMQKFKSFHFDIRLYFLLPGI